MRVLIMTVLLCHLLWSLPGLAATSEEGAEEEREHIRINIRNLRQSISQQQEKVDQTKKEETDMLAQLRRVDQVIEEHVQSMQDLEMKILDQQTLIRRLETELTQARDAFTSVQEHLASRLRSFYLTGKTGILNVTFSQHSLPDLMLFNDSYHALGKYDRDLINQFRGLVRKIEKNKEARELEKVVQEGFLDQAMAKKEELELARAEQEALLDKIKEKKGLYQQVLKEMKRTETDLSTTLLALKQEHENKQRGFLLSKGTLPRPVEGELVHLFGKTKEEPALEADTSRNGITIKTKDKAQVRAVYQGRVIFAGFMRGYGKMVIIEHGLQYFTITARFEELAVAEGDEVGQGQLLGVTGELATLFNDGLYFEIRHGSTPVNPLDWLGADAYAAQ